MTAESIAEMILSQKPSLPPPAVLDAITFQWNSDDLSGWDGGVDLNEDLRAEVVELLDPYFEGKDPDLLNILRFLLEQETLNSNYGEFCSDDLRPIFDYIAEFRRLEDVDVLLDAIHDSSFDANLALDKYKLFLNGYDTTLDYVRANFENAEEMVDSLSFYGQYFGFDSPGWTPPTFDQSLEE